MHSGYRVVSDLPVYNDGSANLKLKNSNLKIKCFTIINDRA